MLSVIFKISSHLCCTTVVPLLSTFKRHNLLQILVLISEVDQVLYKDAERQLLYKKTRTLIVTELVIISVVLVPLKFCYYYIHPKPNFLAHYVILIEIVGIVSVILMVIQFKTIVLILRQNTDMSTNGSIFILIFGERGKNQAFRIFCC